MVKRVIGFTAVRSEYGLLRPVFRAIENHPDLGLRVVVAGAHLVPEFGNTYEEIVADGFSIMGTVNSWVPGDTPRAAMESFSRLVAGLGDLITEESADFILVLGDRNEALAAALVAAQVRVPLAHIHAGDLAGGYNIDDAIRLSISRFAHLHFAASPRSAERLLRSGEEPFRISVVGAPGLDTVLGGQLPSLVTVLKKYGLGRLPPRYFVILQHPVTSEWKQAREQIQQTLLAVRQSGLAAVLIYPNTDPGSEEIIGCLASVSNGQQFFLIPNMEHADFLALVKGSAALVGNSSSGIIEAPALHIPVVNIGPRQMGRERGANVIDVSYNASEIAAALETVQKGEFRSKLALAGSPYGDGSAGSKIADVLASVAIDDRLLQKTFLL